MTSSQEIKNLSTKNVLVAGGAGYIGSHTVRALHDAGYNVFVIDNLSEGHVEAVGDCPLFHADINDSAALDALFTQNKIDAVFHFSAFAYVGESVVEPEKYYFNNVAATLNLLASMRRNNIKNFIFSSTCATYGNPKYIPIDEEHNQSPVNPYGATKLIVERILADYNAAYHLNYIALRYFNAAGAHPDGGIGEAHRIETHLIPLALQTAMGKKNSLSLFGNDYPTPDGTCVRDYIHVCDLADAHIRAMEYLLAGGKSCAVNLGTGRGTSVLEIINAVEKITGKKPNTIISPRRAGDPPELVASNQKAKKILGWIPKWTNINDIIKSAFLWEQTNVWGQKQQ